MKTLLIYFSLSLCLFSANVYSQEKSQEKKEAKIFNTKKWVHTIGIGASRYIYLNVAPGRNEINYKSVGGRVDQSKGRGPVLDIKIQRRYKKNYFGVVFNWFVDIENTGYGYETIGQIKRDSMKNLTIYDNHAYFNWGLNYEREIYRTLKNRLSINAAMSAGYSNNRTPDRLEFDYFKNDFVENSSGYQIIKTKFKDGFFINPSVNAKINIGKNHGITVELNGMFQFHKTVEKLEYDGEFFDFTNGKKQSYQVVAIQLNTKYFF